MTKPRTGSVEPLRRADGSTYCRARIRLADGTRTRVDVPSRHAAPAGGLSGRERAEQWAHARQELEDTTHALLKARQARARSTSSAAKTVDAFAATVFDQREAEGKIVSRERRTWSARVSPRLGDRPVADVTKAEIEEYREYLDAEVRQRIAGGKDDGISGKTALIIWTLVRTVFREASASRDRSKRVREDDPTAGVLAPLKTRARKKTFIYPIEFAALVRCPLVPLAWRETYAVAVYLYLRPGELRALESQHVNLSTRIVSVVQAYDEEGGSKKATKTERGQREVPIPATLVPVLERLCAGLSPTDHVLPVLVDVAETGHGRRAVLVREHLALAGVDRARLLEDTAATMAVNFRSLRDSGITWEALAGTPVDRIQARAGHENIATTIGYCKAVEDFRGAYGAPFGALDFGATSGPTNGPTSHDQAENKLRLQDSNLRKPHESSEIDATRAPEERPEVEVSVRTLESVGPSPATSDEALKLAIKLAVDAGDYTRAGSLLGVAQALARPTAPSAPGAVVDLASRRR